MDIVVFGHELARIALRWATRHLEVADALSGSSGPSVVLLKYTLILVVLTMILFNHCFTDFTDICYARFGEFFLSTDFTDFTDFCYASAGARGKGTRMLYQGYQGFNR